MRPLALAIVFIAACGTGDAGTKSRHAIVIGLDGVRVDALERASTPRIDELIAEGTVSYDAFAGGVLGTETQQPTFSGPGWSSILTGVWIDKHGVQLNVFDEANFDEHPHFFAHVREKDPGAYLASFATWAPINESIASSADVDVVFSSTMPTDSASGDMAVTAAVVSYLASGTPDVVFVQLDEVDHQGHVAGYGPDVPAYVEAIEAVDLQIGEMVDAIRARDTYASEDWLILVTTDHGGTGKGHGGQSDEERTIFMIVSGGDVSVGATVSPGPGHTSVPPTVMKHLGLSIDPQWGYAGDPFGL
ncbi:MAG: alkaline phosphatase family protein [Deltaproteobacteria bacterium]|jgi:predicted AlkP superfamily pyrophosphatase or phosphodiesterase|nr:alkaline phosphatase family protein [Deltaproteobacteria bacterium]